jgi:predicted PurR-regulated permease PerM
MQQYRSDDLRPFVWRVLIVVGIGATIFLVWRIAEALLLIFAGVLIAVLLLHLRDWVHRWTGLPRGWAFALVLVVLAALLAAAGLFLGSRVATEFSALSRQIETAIGSLPQDVTERFGDVGSLFTQFRAVASNVVFFLSNAIVILFAAIYVAASPDLYRRGLVLLFPPRQHDRVREVLDVCGYSLWRWMIGTLASMASVGVLTGLGLWLLDVPAALALGLVAALLEFIPLLGPILAAIPAVLIAFSQGPMEALWVALLYLVIQQIEGNLILPMAQKRMVSLPPVVTLGAIVAGGLLFGLLGIFLATPLAVVLMVIVNLLYIEDTLGEKRQFPG